MWKQLNENPQKKQVGDCTVRAISTALNQNWAETYTGLCLIGFEMADMPSANAVTTAYLKRKGFYRHTIPQDLPECYTVIDFCKDHMDGTYVIGIGTHMVAVIDGDYYDFWDSGYECPLYYFEKNKE